MTKKETFKWIVQIIASVATAILTALVLEFDFQNASYRYRCSKLTFLWGDMAVSFYHPLKLLNISSLRCCLFSFARNLFRSKLLELPSALYSLNRGFLIDIAMIQRFREDSKDFLHIFFEWLRQGRRSATKR